MKKHLVIIFIILLTVLNATAQEAITDITPSKITVYKTVDETSLSLHIFNPPDHTIDNKKPAIVFFFSGGFIQGSSKQFYPQSAYFASRGIVAICVEYRITSEHGSNIIDSLKDANSSMRWIKSQVKELGINPNMITASGGSAGGLISKLLAAGNDFNHYDDDLKINTRPSSLVLFNPQFEIAPKLPTYQPIINRSKEINPLNNLNEATPPTLILHGTEDEFIPISSVKSLQKKMTSYGVRSELVLYDRQKHEFYNKNKYSQTLLEVDKFLVSLGYLNNPAD